MNAPYDRDRGGRPGDRDTAGSGREPYGDGPYGREQEYGQDPYGRSTPRPDVRDMYRQPPPSRHAPDPRRWAPTPAPEPEGPSRRLPYGDDPATVRFTGVDDLLSGAPGEEDGRARDGAFEHLYRDQRAPAPQQPHPHAHPPHWHQGPPPPPYQQPQQPQAGAPGPYGHQGEPMPSQDLSGPPGPSQGFEGQHPPAPGASYPSSPSSPSFAPGPQTSPDPEDAAEPPAETAAKPTRRGGGGGGGGGGGILKSSAIMAAGTMVSRLTGFLRTLVITAALGAAVLGDAYTVAYTLPTMIYILSIGGGLNSVFVPQLVRAMKNDEDGGEAYANRLLTLVVVLLGGLVALTVLGAPLLVRLMSVSIAGNPEANNVAVTFARYCLPTIFFMGVHVVMGQILNARGRFGAMMWTPVLNNVVIITTFGLFIWVYGTARTSGMSVETIPPEGVRLLGVGTLLGLAVQSLAMIPYLRAAGFRVRLRFDWRGHGLGKAARLAKWTFLFVLANQAGVLVVTQLATWAGKAAEADGHSGAGILAYSNAQLIWQMPQAIITVSVMAALLPRISRAAHDGDPGAVRDDISHGLRTSAVAIVPVGFAFVALGVPMCLLMYSSATVDAAMSMGYTLMAFGLGLIPYSVQYVVLRGFYAYEDTRTPFYNTVIVAACNAVGSVLCFLVLPSRWAVVGMAAVYGVAYAVGVGVAWKRLSRRLGGDLDGSRVVRTYIRLCGAGVPAALAGGGVAYAVLGALEPGFLGGAASLVAGGLVLGVVFVLAARRMRIEELTAMMGMVRAKLGR
ncbi:murein biosynthesis integral membrane protein MurJ [Streptomyces sp. TRM43335]|uniref:Murein biosynthesis integral membrane protein MurJ n=1 Tax=Streptomyces taklimakanensis TaxID=2569853 RepID=A0A6G2BD00_9ACTN|nr:murein biosynthesis integral membrane protein MurJ [Streptomyces taklimakanensis]MTE20006.1 murein biosynthesis integral membrane protein MurJ [Streptomyces taklimakanensis]